MAKVTKQIQQLFLRLLNFAPELLNKTQEEAKLQNTSFDALIRTAVEKHLRDLTVAREQPEAEQEQEAKEYATLLLRAHFAEDRNEFLTADDIRSWYK
ncbi:MAG TPA: hypothetical protein VJX72_05425 [Candidatus Acidoferrum sp.]|nr:hypothetical protein [Candidatus Acidoferrum sp.]